MVMPVSYLNALEPVLVPHSQRASAGIAELSDRTGGVVFVFDVQVHGPVALLLAVLRHKGGGCPPGRGVQENVTTSKSQTTIRRIL